MLFQLKGKRISSFCTNLSRYYSPLAGVAGDEFELQYALFKGDEDNSAIQQWSRLSIMHVAITPLCRVCVTLSIDACVIFFQSHARMCAAHIYILPAELSLYTNHVDRARWQLILRTAPLACMRCTGGAAERPGNSCSIIVRLQLVRAPIWCRKNATGALFAGDGYAAQNGEQGDQQMACNFIVAFHFTTG